ncbi:Integrase p49 [Ceratocystis platani]|uniref:Integrase p49 n=1 Tax=Ceratocystis fimbriata f. sp. platani TaxID=88771 RepID=A0A0F8AW70_CERFI|nr:Integrase p49 [Ceratocystis platani]
MSPLYRQAKSKNHTATQFLKALDAIFLDPHAEERAEAELYRLSQGNNEPFSVFMPKFENLLLEAGIVGDRACISILKRCLNDELIRAVCTGVKAKTHPAFVSEVFGLASDLEALRGRQTRMNTHPRFGHWTPAPAPPTQAAPSPDKMDWQPSNVLLKPITPGKSESLKHHSHFPVYASLHDIEKALQTKIYTDPRTSCPSWLLPVISAFDRKKAATLPPSRPGLDTEIRLKADESTPACPLYSMSREELLVLRKTLYELLDSSFIRASSAEGGAPVIFVKKPGGGIRFCIDYRALNNATEKDGYPLPLIHDTLRDIASAKYVSKVDVIYITSPAGIEKATSRTIGLLRQPIMAGLTMRQVLSG